MSGFNVGITVMPDYLLEIGTEELPANHGPEAQQRLKTLLAEALNEANVKFHDIETLGTPRRLTCFVRQISPLQDTVTKKVAGPAVKAGFDAGGKPLPAAVKFAEKHGLTVEKLGREEIGGVEKLVANLTIEGKPVGEVLKEIVPQVIVQLSGERPMRWGSSDLKFSRPIRWLVSLLDSEEVPVGLDGIKSGRASFGNRVLAPGKVTIKSSSEYVAALKSAKVVADPSERQAIIEKQVEDAAKGVGGKARQLKGPLLQEVVNITEWPHAVVGEFAREYLDLPDTLIETIMVHHQRYFPIEKAQAADSKHNLLPYFVTVANNDHAAAQPIIKQGNERVIRARLADGRFFYFDDQKSKLSEREDKLTQLTFQEGLGSFMEKTERLSKAARVVSDSLRLDAKTTLCLEETVKLCKLDLVTNLVRELPELQGYVGSWYAEKESQPPDVVAAIASHYAPRYTDDEIPADTVGQYASIIDKLDNLVGLFALGRRASGSSDPFALRRQGQGVIDIMIDGLKEKSIDITALIEFLLTLMEPLVKNRKGFDRDKTIADLREFLMQRLRLKLQETGYRRETIDAVLSASDPFGNPKDVIVRLSCVEQLIKSSQGLNLVRVGVRIGNIIGAVGATAVNPQLFDSDAERQLWESFQKDVVSGWASNGNFKQPASADEYRKVLDLLVRLAAPVDVFFDKVMVNDPDAAKRNNRHGMLNLIYQYFGAVADFPKLQPLLP
jgi:glycyl-tRNA synthetase beta chain